MSSMENRHDLTESTYGEDDISENMLFDGDSLFMATMARESSSSMCSNEGKHDSFQDEPSASRKAKQGKPKSHFEDFIPRRTIGVVDMDDASTTSSKRTSFSETALGKLMTSRRGLAKLQKSKTEKVAAKRSSNQRRITNNSKKKPSIKEGRQEKERRRVMEDLERAALQEDAMYVEALTKGTSQQGTSCPTHEGHGSGSKSNENYLAVSKEFLRTSTKRPRSILAKIRDPERNQGVSWPYYENIMPGETDDLRHMPNHKSDKRASDDDNLRRRWWWMVALMLAVTLLITLSIFLTHSHDDPSPGEPEVVFDLGDAGDFAHLFKDPSLYHDWSKKGHYHTEQLYFLHPASFHSKIAVKTPKAGRKGDAITLFVVSTRHEDPLVSSIMDNLYGHSKAKCTSTWPDAVEHKVPDKDVVLLPMTGEDMQVIVCNNNRFVASATHMFVKSWKDNKPSHELQVLDFYNSDPPSQQFEAMDDDRRLYLLLISSVRNPTFMYVEDQESVGAFNRTLTEHPDRTHPCHDSNPKAKTLTVDNPVETLSGGDSQLVLWDLSQIRDAQDDPAWTNLVWNCDMDADEIQQPIGHVSIT